MENHHISIDNRQRISITQVTDVDAFDEETLWANLKEGSIEITGEKLNMEKLDLDQGVLILTGRVDSLTYTDKVPKVKRKFMERFGQGRK